MTTLGRPNILFFVIKIVSVLWAPVFKCLLASHSLLWLILISILCFRNENSAISQFNYSFAVQVMSSLEMNQRRSFRTKGTDRFSDYTSNVVYPSLTKTFFFLSFCRSYNIPTRSLSNLGGILDVYGIRSLVKRKYVNG